MKKAVSKRFHTVSRLKKIYFFRLERVGGHAFKMIYSLKVDLFGFYDAPCTLAHSPVPLSKQLHQDYSEMSAHPVITAFSFLT